MPAYTAPDTIFSSPHKTCGSLSDNSCFSDDLNTDSPDILSQITSHASLTLSRVYGVQSQQLSDNHLVMIPVSEGSPKKPLKTIQNDDDEEHNKRPLPSAPPLSNHESPPNNIDKKGRRIGGKNQQELQKQAEDIVRNLIAPQSQVRTKDAPIVAERGGSLAGSHSVSHPMEESQVSKNQFLRIASPGLRLNEAEFLPTNSVVVEEFHQLSSALYAVPGPPHHYLPNDFYDHNAPIHYLTAAVCDVFHHEFEPEAVQQGEAFLSSINTKWTDPGLTDSTMSLAAASSPSGQSVQPKPPVELTRPSPAAEEAWPTPTVVPEILKKPEDSPVERKDGPTRKPKDLPSPPAVLNVKTSRTTKKFAKLVTPHDEHPEKRAEVLSRKPVTRPLGPEGEAKAQTVQSQHHGSKGRDSQPVLPQSQHRVSNGATRTFQSPPLLAKDQDSQPDLPQSQHRVSDGQAKVLEILPTAKAEVEVVKTGGRADSKHRQLEDGSRTRSQLRRLRGRKSELKIPHRGSQGKDASADGEPKAQIPHPPSEPKVERKSDSESNQRHRDSADPPQAVLVPTAHQRHFFAKEARPKLCNDAALHSASKKKSGQPDGSVNQKKDQREEPRGRQEPSGRKPKESGGNPKKAGDDGRKGSERSSKSSRDYPPMTDAPTVSQSLSQRTSEASTLDRDYTFHKSRVWPGIVTMSLERTLPQAKKMVIFNNENPTGAGHKFVLSNHAYHNWDQVLDDWTMRVQPSSSGLVFRNGDVICSSIRVMLKGYDLYNMDRVMDAIGQKVRPTNGGVRSLMTLTGKPINHVKDLVPSGFYVALGFVERFIKDVQYRVNGAHEEFIKPIIRPNIQKRIFRAPARDVRQYPISNLLQMSDTSLVNHGFLPKKWKKSLATSVHSSLEVGHSGPDYVSPDSQTSIVEPSTKAPVNDLITETVHEVARELERSVHEMKSLNEIQI
ncbi:hypothetical protein BV898_05204 [Hypsibius exemplaris]|uniref:Doublecortin domain-containing protein n=1 Tax=Hypsibius exemplaris TaxID=2072580 RepID=A0A1W0X0P2_HYPEX|nr:hypothetical protein BV898_05204 [Hypsibius exemplaris]